MPAPHHSGFTGWMPFLLPNQQHQSTEGTSTEGKTVMANTLSLKQVFKKWLQKFSNKTNNKTESSTQSHLLHSYATIIGELACYRRQLLEQTPALLPLQTFTANRISVKT